MPTLGELLSTTRHRLLGVGSYTERVSQLMQDIEEGTLTIQVDEIVGQGREVIEIGLEKIRLKRADSGNRTLTAYDFGRGYDGTLQSSHARGDEVTWSPQIPNFTIVKEINNLLESMYPLLYGVVTVDLVYNHSAESPFVLPDDAVDVVAVFRETRHAHGYERVDSWRFEPDSGRGLVVQAPAGTNLRVVYARRIGTFDLTDPNVLEADFESATGLEERVAHLIPLGVGARLASFYDFGKLGSTGMESRADGAGKALGAGIQVANRLYQEFQVALEQEAQVLHKHHPIRLHREKVVYGRW
jgi:hypothetical protein